MRGKVWIACLIVASPVAAVSDETIATLPSGERVTISGVVDRVSNDDTFILRDETGSIPVYLGPNRVPVEVGMAVTVHGIVDDDVPREIYANRPTDTAGTRFDFEHGDG